MFISGLLFVCAPFNCDHLAKMRENFLKSKQISLNGRWDKYRETSKFAFWQWLSIRRRYQTHIQQIRKMKGKDVCRICTQSLPYCLSKRLFGKRISREMQAGCSIFSVNNIIIIKYYQILYIRYQRKLLWRISKRKRFSSVIIFKHLSSNEYDKLGRFTITYSQWKA